MGPKYFCVNIERPHQEQTFYDMMRDESVDITHWYKQIGFNQTDIHLDLKKLTMEEEGSRDITLLVFRSQYPQSHGGLRDSLPMGVAMMFTDACQSYMMDEEYHNQEARRKTNREERKNGKTNFGVKHDDTKAFQIESAAVATTKKCETYQQSLINGLPDSIKAKIVVRRLKNLGSL
eukprot:scaffold217766_cov49-Attheya_sp.AAC.5